MIDHYQFGLITINGQKYDFDVEVRPKSDSDFGSEIRSKGEVLRWQREESHVFNLKDVERAVGENPEIIVLGTGAYGLAQVSEKVQEFFKNKEVKLIIEKTDQAVKSFNNLIKKKKKVVGLFHLTC